MALGNRNIRGTVGAGADIIGSGFLSRVSLGCTGSSLVFFDRFGSALKAIPASEISSASIRPSQFQRRNTGHSAGVLGAALGGFIGLLLASGVGLVMGAWMGWVILADASKHRKPCITGTVYDVEVWMKDYTFVSVQVGSRADADSAVSAIEHLLAGADQG